jgi:hypothetical protein
LAVYDEVGFARSLLAYELPDGRLKLIDGHLRRDLDPDIDVEVEILDVTDAEARALLLSIDPHLDPPKLGLPIRDQQPSLRKLWDNIFWWTNTFNRDAVRLKEPIPQFPNRPTEPGQTQRNRNVTFFRQPGRPRLGTAIARLPDDWIKCPTFSTQKLMSWRV